MGEGLGEKDAGGSGNGGDEFVVGLEDVGEADVSVVVVEDDVGESEGVIVSGGDVQWLGLYLEGWLATALC